MERLRRRAVGFNQSARSVDHMCRVLYPLSFVVFVVIYRSFLFRWKEDYCITTQDLADVAHGNAEF